MRAWIFIWEILEEEKQRKKYCSYINFKNKKKEMCFNDSS